MAKKNTSEQVLDELLVLQVQGGDAEALEALVKRWHGKLLRQAYHHVKDLESSRDVVQESWQAIVKGINSLRDPARFGVWALTITNRKSFRWVKSRQLERSHNNLQDEVRDHLYTDQEDNSQIIEKIQESLRKIPDNQRIVVSMFYMGGHSVHEISSILHVPVGTIKSRLYHAREHLKEILKSYRS